MYTSRLLRNLFSDYIINMYAFAHNEFDKTILPYLKKHKLNFLTGHGTFFIDFTEETDEKYKAKYSRLSNVNKLDVDRLPERIKDVLFMEIEGLPANNLGSLMPDYISGEEK